MGIFNKFLGLTVGVLVAVGSQGAFATDDPSITTTTTSCANAVTQKDIDVCVKIRSYCNISYLATVTGCIEICPGSGIVGKKLGELTVTANCNVQLKIESLTPGDAWKLMKGGVASSSAGDKIAYKLTFTKTSLGSGPSSMVGQGGTNPITSAPFTMTSIADPLKFDVFLDVAASETSKACGEYKDTVRVSCVPCS